jgi:hypothetical protein
MAMRSCPECLNQIDENESVCPHCGHVLLGDEPGQKSVEVYLEERKWTFGNTLIALLLVLLIGGLGWLLFLVLVAAGAIGGYYYFRFYRPSLEEDDVESENMEYSDTRFPTENEDDVEES